MEKQYVFVQNPKIDFLIGSRNNTIPSKTEAFKPITLVDNETKEVLNDY
ncbi:MAG: hypothetical protein ABJA71_13270 [Ginsengibacter sp.]